MDYLNENVNQSFAIFLTFHFFLYLFDVPLPSCATHANLQRPLGNRYISHLIFCFWWKQPNIF